MAEIVVEFQHNNNGNLLHRIGNFYEDVYIAYRDSKEASVVSDIDALNRPLKMVVSGSRKVSCVSQQIKQLIEKHGLSDLATIARFPLNSSNLFTAVIPRWSKILKLGAEVFYRRSWIWVILIAKRRHGHLKGEYSFPTQWNCTSG